MDRRQYGQVVTRTILAVTGVILLSLAGIEVLTGLCLRDAAIASMLNQVIERGTCSYLHAELIPSLLIPIGILHAIASAETVSTYFRSSGRLYRIVGEFYRVTAWVLSLLILGLYIIDAIQP